MYITLIMQNIRPQNAALQIFFSFRLTAVTRGNV